MLLRQGGKVERKSHQTESADCLRCKVCVYNLQIAGHFSISASKNKFTYLLGRNSKINLRLTQDVFVFLFPVFSILFKIATDSLIHKLWIVIFQLPFYFCTQSQT
jgi:hypothetical protein